VASLWLPANSGNGIAPAFWAPLFHSTDLASIQWEADLSAFFVSRYYESGASATAAQYAALNAPNWLAKIYTNNQLNYWPVIRSTLNYNMGVSYTFGHTEDFWIRDTTFRFGAINVLDEKPPLAPNNLGIDTALYLQLAVGRQFTFEISRHF